MVKGGRGGGVPPPRVSCTSERVEVRSPRFVPVSRDFWISPYRARISVGKRRGRRAYLETVEDVLE